MNVTVIVFIVSMQLYWSVKMSTEQTLKKISKELRKEYWIKDWIETHD